MYAERSRSRGIVGRWAKAASALRRRWNLPIRQPPVRSYIHIAEPSARAILRETTESLDRIGIMNGRTLDQVGGVAAQPVTLVQRLVDEADLTLLEVAQPAVDELGALRRGARGEVVALDEGDAQATGDGIERHAGAGDAAADHEHVEHPVVELFHHVLSAEAVERHRSHPTEDEARGGHRLVAASASIVVVTSTYDPGDARYVDEAATRSELTRVFDVCAGCRHCVDRCGAFPLLFALVDRHADREAGRLTPAQQDAVTDECFGCDRCLTECPYAPGRDPAAVDVPVVVDVPAVMARATAMRRANHHLPRGAQPSGGPLSPTSATGRVAAAMPSVANVLTGAADGSVVRRALRLATGVSATRVMPPFTRQRFSTWFARRPRVRLVDRQASVAVFPTCIVDLHEPGIGHDLVKVYERNGIECRPVDGVRCCGAALLDGGDVRGFAALARANAAALAEAIRDGHDVIVAQPTCSAVLRDDYPVHAPGADAELVAAHTFDACEYLMKLHRGATTRIDTAFGGDVPVSVVCHVPCHVRRQDAGLASRDLLKLTGARVVLAEGCAGVGSWRGLRAAHDAGAQRLAGLLAAVVGEAVEGVGGSVAVTGDCHLANTAIGEHAGIVPRHPLQVLARAYGIAEEP
ncbi:MAG: heterodisulfide reductase-related iron-sulfur binding cluster [Ilumatobacteraceae bacterium]